MSERKFICAILVIIIICSIALSSKILANQKYDEKLYNEVYDEYNSIFKDNKIEENYITDSYANNSSENNEITYLYTNSLSAKNKENEDDKVIAQISIPKIDLQYPVLNQTTEAYLKIAPCRYWGGEPNTFGNLSIIAHNYNNSKLFSNINKLENGDEVILKSKTERKITYKVIDKFEVANNDFSCTNVNTKGTMDLTLITCTNRNSNMYVVKCRASI